MGQETPITAKYRRCSGCHAEFFKHPERASLLLFNTLRFAIHKNGKIYLSNKVLRLQVLRTTAVQRSGWHRRDYSKEIR